MEGEGFRMLKTVDYMVRSITETKICILRLQQYKRDTQRIWYLWLDSKCEEKPAFA